MSVKEERKFLHDLATPISTVFFLLDMTIDRLAAEQEKNAEELKMLEGAVRSLRTAKELLQKRRDYLVSLEVQSDEQTDEH